MKKQEENKQEEFLITLKSIFDKGEEFVIDIVKQNPEWLYDVDLGGNNLLIWAARENMPKLTKFLVEDKGFDLNMTNNQGNTALHAVCTHNRFYNRNIEDIKYLIEHKKSDLSLKNNAYNNVLQSACRQDNSFEVIKYLIDTEKFDLAEIDDKNNSLVHLALYKNNPNVEVIRYFIEAKKFDISVKNSSDDNLLHYACRRGDTNLKTIKYLVETEYFRLSEQNIDGNSPLHLACDARKPNLDVIKYLIDQGSKYKQINNAGNTPIKLLKNNEMFKNVYKEILEHAHASEFANSLISTKLSQVDSTCLVFDDSEESEKQIKLIISCVKNKIYNLTGINNIENFFEDYTKANQILKENLEFLNSKDIYIFNDLTPNTHIPILKLQSIMKMAENEISITDRNFNKCFSNCEGKFKFYVELIEQIQLIDPVPIAIIGDQDQAN